MEGKRFVAPGPKKDMPSATFDDTRMISSVNEEGMKTDRSISRGRAKRKQKMGQASTKAPAKGFSIQLNQMSSTMRRTSIPAGA
jgi:hypothetical protein